MVLSKGNTLQPAASSAELNVASEARKGRLPKALLPQRYGIATKLNLLAIAIILLTAGAIGLAVVRIQSVLALDALRTHGTAITWMLAEAGAISSESESVEMLNRLLDSLEGNTDVVYAAFYDDHGKPVVERRHGPLDAVPDMADQWPTEGERIVVRSLDEGKLLSFVACVNHLRATPRATGQDSAAEHPRRGHAALILSSTRARDEVLAFVKETTRLTIVVAAIAIVLTLLFTRRLVQPIHELARAAREVADGQLGQTVTVHSNDELADLGRAFQHMIDKLGASRSRLLQYQNQLEDRVRARTRELEQATAHAIDLAQRDLLTHLPNRAYFGEMLERALNSHRGTGERLAVLFLDVDLFKRINDTLGHHAGDLLLVQIAETLRSCVRDGDLVARLGGDEFVMIARDVRNTEQITTIARRILNAFASPIELDGQTLKIDFSIGISLCPEDGTDAQSLLRCADLAMYATKDSGRGTYRFYTPELNQRAKERLTIENGLRDALSSDSQLYLEFQPQVTIDSGDLVAAEALLRWQSPDEGLIMPGRFIPVAEETGLIVPIGNFVLNEACAAIARWRDSGLPMPRIAVNISALQFEQQDFCDTVARALDHHGVPADRLELELTESVIMRNANASLREMQHLKELGVSIALDDFGTGYSSLAYLSRLPIDVVKIDRSFVLQSIADGNAQTIVRTIAALSHALGCSVVAEGVESYSQLGLLRGSGCDYLQGYLIGRPMGEKSLTEWLSTDLTPAVACLRAIEEAERFEM